MSVFVAQPRALAARVAVGFGALAAGLTALLLAATGGSSTGAGALPAARATDAHHGLGSLPLAARMAVSRGVGSEDHSYWIAGRDGVLSATDSPGRLRFSFATTGMTVIAPGGSAGVGLVALGRGGVLRTLSSVTPVAHRNRVSYTRRGVVEWYANGPAGLEQGFTLSTRPAGAAGRPVALALALSGGLRAHVETGGRAMTFAGANGRNVLSYGGLTVTDAHGRALRSWLELHGRRLLVRIDDAGASYPLRVDPFFHQNAELTAPGSTDEGNSVGISGSTIAVTDGGSVYVYEEPAGGWANATPVATLTPSDDSNGIGAVAISGSTIVVGAPAAHKYSGAVFVFSEPAGGWVNAQETATLTPSDGGHYFGAAVATSGSTIAATDSDTSKPGAVYVYTEPAGGWVNATENAKLTDSSGTVFLSLAMSGSTIVAGAPYESSPSVSNFGAAYVFSEPAGGWTNATQTARLTATDSGQDKMFGWSVATDGPTVAVGDIGDNFPGTGGAVFVYSEPAGGWADATQTAKLTTATATDPDYVTLGDSVAVSGRTIVAGDRNAVDNLGALVVFSEPPSGWANASQANAILYASNGLPFDFDGTSTAISGTTIVGGAPGVHNINPNQDPLGAAFEFNLPDVDLAIDPHADITVNATGPSGAAVTFTPPLAGDGSDPAPAVQCSPVSGSTFPIGTTTVTCSASDSDDANGPVTTSFNVTVTPSPSDLALTGVPADITTTAKSESGAPVMYTPPTATDGSDPAPSVQCAPASGSTYPVGATTVTCSASDADDPNSPVNATFHVTVTQAPTSLVAAPQLGPPGTMPKPVGSGNVTATLTSVGAPLPDEKIMFTVKGKPLCSAVTSAAGTATCKLKGIQELQVIGAGSYQAAFIADAAFAAATASTPVIVRAPHKGSATS